MKKRALIVGAGALRGAYDAGVVAELCRELGANYFDSLYGCSAGSYAVTFFAADQPDVIENVWRNYLDGNKFVHFLNPLRNHHILDLEYLNDLFRRGDTSLRIENISDIFTRLTYVLTERRTARPIYCQPVQENIFSLMNASSAMPFVHSPVVIDGVAYIDGVLSDSLPFVRALADGNEEVVVVYNKPEGFLVSDKYDTSSRVLAKLLPSGTARLIKALGIQYEKVEEQLKSESSVKVIRPKTQLPLESIFDTNKQRLNACVDMGIADAQEFLKTYHG